MGKKFNELFTINNQGIYNGLDKKLNETKDLTGIYKALFDYIIEQSGTGAALENYIENPDLQYLEGTDNGTSITYKLSKDGKIEFLKRIIEEKKRVYEKWKEHHKITPENDLKKLEGEIEKLEEEIKKENDTVINKLDKLIGWPGMDNRGKSIMKPGKLDKAIEALEKQIKVSFLSNDNDNKVEVTSYIKIVEQITKIGTNNEKDHKITDWLFGKEITIIKRKGEIVYLDGLSNEDKNKSGNEQVTCKIKSLKDKEERIKIVNLFVDYCRSRCFKNSTQKANKERAGNIINKLNDNNLNLDQETKKRMSKNKTPPGNKEFYAALKESLKTKLNDKNNNVKSLLNGSCITFSKPGDVMHPALEEYKNHINYTYGIADLDRARKLSFDEGIEVNALLVDLLREAQQIVQKLPLEFKNGKANFLNGENVQLFVLEQVDTLNKQRSRMGVYSDGETYKTGDVASTKAVNDEGELNRPLVHIASKTINFVNKKDNAFFILDRDNPNMAYHVKKKNGGSNEHVDIDFKNRKINGDEKDKTFFKELQTLISDSISGRLDWQALYQVGPSNNKVTTHLIWKTSGGGGHGIGRADDVKKDQYLWEYCGPTPTQNEDYSRLGEIIGLERDRKIIDNKVGGKGGKGGKDGKDLKKYDAPITLEAKFNYENGGEENTKKVRYSMIGILEKKKVEGENIDVETETYIQVNTPYKHGANLKTALGTGGNKNDAEEILKIFQFKYYRKINDNNKVIKSEGGRNRPKEDDVQRNENDKKDENIPLNPPICFQSGENYKNFKKFKKERGVIKNKGENLFTQSKPREDAGRTMEKIITYVKNALLSGVTGRLPATKLARVIIEKQNSIALPDWRNLKGTGANDLPTDQEWCHLRGHGDGGAERLGNFVSGSFHCNTEQLAIEMGQRITTHAGTTANYILKSTAYLLKDDSMESSKYNNAKFGGGYKKNGKTEIEGLSEKDLNLTKQNAPVASFIRYKVYRKNNGTGGYTKILDYTFEGQSEFFDKNQYKILNYTVRFLLAGKEEFDKWYEEKKDDKIESIRREGSKSTGRSASGSPNYTQPTESSIRREGNKRGRSESSSPGRDESTSPRTSKDVKKGKKKVKKGEKNEL
jgi:hypothetical protein